MSTSPVIDLRSKSFFDLTEEERQERLRPAYEAMKTEKFAKGGYLVYYDPALCPTDRHMIQEYIDRKELIKLDHNGKGHFVKNL